jgi:hypothetical protein
MPKIVTYIVPTSRETVFSSNFFCAIRFDDGIVYSELSQPLFEEESRMPLSSEEAAQMPGSSTYKSSIHKSRVTDDEFNQFLKNSYDGGSGAPYVVYQQDIEDGEFKEFLKKWVETRKTDNEKALYNGGCKDHASTFRIIDSLFRRLIISCFRKKLEDLKSANIKSFMDLDTEMRRVPCECKDLYVIPESFSRVDAFRVIRRKLSDLYNSWEDILECCEQKHEQDLKVLNFMLDDIQKFTAAWGDECASLFLEPDDDRPSRAIYFTEDMETLKNLVLKKIEKVELMNRFSIIVRELNDPELDAAKRKLNKLVRKNKNHQADEGEVSTAISALEECAKKLKELQKSFRFSKKLDYRGPIAFLKSACKVPLITGDISLQAEILSLENEIKFAKNIGSNTKEIDARKWYEKLIDIFKALMYSLATWCANFAFTSNALIFNPCILIKNSAPSSESKELKSISYREKFVQDRLQDVQDMVQDMKEMIPRRLKWQ